MTTTAAPPASSCDAHDLVIAHQAFTRASGLAPDAVRGTATDADTVPRRRAVAVDRDQIADATLAVEPIGHVADGRTGRLKRRAGPTAFGPDHNRVRRLAAEVDHGYLVLIADSFGHAVNDFLVRHLSLSCSSSPVRQSHLTLEVYHNPTLGQQATLQEIQKNQHPRQAEWSP